MGLLRKPEMKRSVASCSSSSEGCAQPRRLWQFSIPPLINPFSGVRHQKERQMKDSGSKRKILSDPANRYWPSMGRDGIYAWVQGKCALSVRIAQQ